MSARQRIMADEDGGYEDWIELYNCTDKEIDLSGWYLSDRYDRPLQWQFPAVTIPAKGFLVLWASGKDRSDEDELEKPVAASARATNMEKYLAFPWKGEYFAGMPIHLNISPREGYQFSHWESQGITADIAGESHIELAPHSDSIVTAVLKKQS